MENPWISPWATVDPEPENLVAGVSESAIDTSLTKLDLPDAAFQWADENIGGSVAWAASGHGDTPSQETVERPDSPSVPVPFQNSLHLTEHGTLGNKLFQTALSTNQSQEGVSTEGFVAQSTYSDPWARPTSPTEKETFGGPTPASWAESPTTTCHAVSERASELLASSDVGVDAEIQGTGTKQTSRHPSHEPTLGDQQPVSRVQGLVDMYDGMARGNIPTILPNRHDENPSSRQCGPGDNGWMPNGSTCGSSPKNDLHMETTSTATKVPSTFYHNKISELFDGLGSLPAIHLEDITEAYGISFGSISERRAWYRISRQGSARMHNSGDEENYRRVIWPRSAIQEQTCRIVRRWMEEDALPSRQLRGGTAAKSSTSGFNWDRSSSSDAVDLTILLQRRPTVKTAQTSRTESSAIAGIGSGTSIFATDSQVFDLRKNSIEPPKSLRNVHTANNEHTATPPTAASSQAGHPNWDERAGKLTETLPKSMVESEEDWGEMVVSGTDPRTENPFNQNGLALPGVLQMSANEGPSLDTPRDRTSLPNHTSTEIAIRPLSITPTPNSPVLPSTLPSSRRDEDLHAGTIPAQTSSSPRRANYLNGSTITSDELAIMNNIVQNLPDLSYMLR